ncbi:O-acetylhomoserine aminocarboxypropyltransferase/cysteine synthase family protein [Porphyromonas pogonae]|uniref:O-acetylhomoserine aminocarboxypropyltransferase/cysteine synthase family protein n=1 Tax=Porphyromonas pogonae TaxID=867595 RepID=UPI002E7A1206|nr:O-acetylhomoserine aminocarboxypropyltransferase/cysteine synthase family protein [Porphyromonas pogonae]
MSTNRKTQALHVGFNPTHYNGATSVPLFQGSAYQFRDSDHAAAVFDLTEPGYIYTRLNNPTTDILEQRLAAIEGGIGCVATASGMSAIATTILTLLNAGDHIVSSSSIYGGTFNLFSVALPRFGINTTFVDPDDMEAFERAITPDTKLIYTEALGNPKLNFADIGKLSHIAHSHFIPLIVDNTITPGLLKPIEYGADIVIHSLTKYICGNGTALGGAIIDSGKFNWANGNFPDFTEPSPGYHGLVYWEVFNKAAFIVRARVEGLRDLGSTISPANSFQIIQGLETLDVRLKRVSENAMNIAQWLYNHPLVKWVNYPGLTLSPYYKVCSQYLRDGFGGLLTFGPKGGYESAKKVADSTHIFSLVANLGDTKSLLIHPSSTTHRQLTEEQQRQAGVTPDLIRLSVGLEDVEDLKSDLDQALIVSASNQP